MIGAHRAVEIVSPVAARYGLGVFEVSHEADLPQSLGGPPCEGVTTTREGVHVLHGDEEIRVEHILHELCHLVIDPGVC